MKKRKLESSSHKYNNFVIILQQTIFMQFNIKNISDWQNVVDSILPELKHNILLLKGNLGAGKTTFTQFLLKNLGSKDEVNSPTYSIVNEYNSPKGKIYHFDLYRLKNIEEVYDIGIEEYLDNAFLCIIEWPEVYEDELYGLNYHSMSINNTGENREITFD
ncbi:MAG: tRNA ((37)-N6)-threonylcarbamoyltransferase complex ATPase subunit type 1 TsaE [Chryseobacterium indoltheticum]|jgi:tRNA threonylcarbamoyladenosine biosynthesis protein TsaE|nr:tRNA ((37)-N6)-threonylcarbamoyltransferase complex ATPase subunit type 1 TsaE [Chryseobacterium indoltheticum]